MVWNMFRSNTDIIPFIIKNYERFVYLLTAIVSKALDRNEPDMRMSTAAHVIS